MDENLPNGVDILGPLGVSHHIISYDIFLEDFHPYNIIYILINFIHHIVPLILIALQVLSTILICFSHEKIHVLLISNCFISQMDRINLMNLKGY
jgi:hypothetical protein